MPAGRSDGESAALKRISQVFGLFAGLATIVYIAGGFVLALRLGFEDLPWEAVLSQLPKEFLISIGVTTVILPALLGASLYGGWRLLDNADTPSQGLIRCLYWPACWALGLLRYLASKPLAAAALLVAPGIAIEVAKDGLRDEDGWRGSLLVWGLVALAITVVWLYAMRGLRELIVKRDSSQWNKAGPIFLMSALYAGFLLPGAIVVGAALPLLDMKACTAGGSERTGALVGETEQRLYYGEGRAKGADGDRRLLSLPADKVTELFVGRGAKDIACKGGLQEAGK